MSLVDKKKVEYIKEEHMSLKLNLIIANGFFHWVGSAHPLSVFCPKSSLELRMNFPTGIRNRNENPSCSPQELV